RRQRRTWSACSASSNSAMGRVPASASQARRSVRLAACPGSCGNVWSGPNRLAVGSLMARLAGLGVPPKRESRSPTTPDTGSVLRVAVVQPQLSGHAVQGAGELLATPFRRPTQSRGDLRPLLPLGAAVGQLPLLVRQPPPQLGEQLAVRDDAAGAVYPVGRL